MVGRQLTVCLLERQSHVPSHRAESPALRAVIDHNRDGVRLLHYGQAGVNLLRGYFSITSWRRMFYARN